MVDTKSRNYSNSGQLSECGYSGLSPVPAIVITRETISVHTLIFLLLWQLRTFGKKKRFTTISLGLLTFSTGHPHVTETTFINQVSHSTLRKDSAL